VDVVLVVTQCGKGTHLQAAWHLFEQQTRNARGFFCAVSLSLYTSVCVCVCLCSSKCVCVCVRVCEIVCVFHMVKALRDFCETLQTTCFFFASSKNFFYFVDPVL